MASLAPVGASAAPDAGRRVTVDFDHCAELLPDELDLIAALLGDDLVALLTAEGITGPRGAGRDHRTRVAAR